MSGGEKAYATEYTPTRLVGAEKRDRYLGMG